MKWTAFDQETAATLAQHLSGVGLSQHPDALETAIAAAANAHVALVCPASEDEAALLVTFRNRSNEAPEASLGSAEPVAYAAGGFLGLSDEPIFDEKKRPR